MMQKDVTIGGLILLASVATTCVFESALVRSIRSFEEGRSIVITLSKPHVLTSNEGQLILFSGLITTTASDIKSQWNIRNPGAQPVRQSPFVLDPTFGVAVKGVRLHRHVEMLQWVETSHTSMSSTPEDEDRRFDDDRERIFMYNMQWSENIISSIGFDDPSHANPPSEAWKYTSLVVKANDLVVGDFLLPESLVDQIQRKDIVPLDAANRRLMANLLVQRKGAEWDEYSALKNVSVQDNYLYFHDGVPVVGDQRVFFEVTPNYPVTVCAKQNGHDLEPFKSSTGESIFLLQDGMMTSSEFFDKKIRAKVHENWFYRLFAGVLGSMGFLVLRRPLIERFGSLLAGIQQHLLASSMSVALIFSIAGANWVVFRPLWTLIFLVSGWMPTLSLVMFRVKHPQKSQ